MITLSINNIPVEVPEGTTILDAAKQAGIRIPTLCYVEGLAGHRRLPRLRGRGRRGAQPGGLLLHARRRRA